MNYALPDPNQSGLKRLRGRFHIFMNIPSAVLIASISVVVMLAGCTGNVETSPEPEATVAGVATAALQQPYAGLQEREIKALDVERVQDLLAGHGAGYALAAELNSYPGPTHVIQLSERLELTGDQIQAVETIFESMSTDAKIIGAELVATEADLDQLFSDGTIDYDELARLTATSAEIEGKLRSVHLGAHLSLKEMLTEAQIEMYDRLRGYSGHGHESMDHTGMHG